MSKSLSPLAFQSDQVLPLVMWNPLPKFCSTGCTRNPPGLPTPGAPQVGNEVAFGCTPNTPQSTHISPHPGCTRKSRVGLRCTRKTPVPTYPKHTRKYPHFATPRVHPQIPGGFEVHPEDTRKYQHFDTCWCTRKCCEKRIIIKPSTFYLWYNIYFISLFE